MTSLQQLQAWVEQGESETQEFKLSSGQRTDAARTICAFPVSYTHLTLPTSDLV